MNQSFIPPQSVSKAADRGLAWTEAEIERASTEAIKADRSQLQNEIVKHLRAAENVSPEEWHHYRIAEGIIQSVFSQSLPVESKDYIDREKKCGRTLYQGNAVSVCTEHQMISVAESDRRIQAEREACAALCDYWAYDGEPGHGTAKRIKADILRRSNPSPVSESERFKAQREEWTKKQRQHVFVGSLNYDCLYCGWPFSHIIHLAVDPKEEAEESAKKKESEPDRIAVLHSLLGEQSETINQLLEEKHVLQKQLEDVRIAIGAYSLFDDGERPNNRKA